MGVSKGLIAVALLCSSFGAEGRAQEAGAAPPPPAAGSTVLQVVARRISVDVVVTDAKGKPVRGLTRDDFKVSEDGTPQAMRSFDLHVLEHAASGAALPKPPDLPPHTYANLVRAPEDGPVTILLYDVLNTPVQSMPYAHQAIVKFIKNQPPGSRTAIFVLGDKLRMLQGFTDDETRLLTAINAKGAGTQQSTLLLNGSTSGQPAINLLADNPDTPVDPTATGPTSILGELNNMEQMEELFQLQERLDMTLDAFAEIARFVTALPGRKNLLWLSGSFPGSILPSSDPAANGTSAEFGLTLNSDREVKEANDLLNAAHVSVYPVDVRGLQVDTMYSVASNAHVKAGAPMKSTFSENLNAEHSTMDEIADNTGGHAFYNTNGLIQAMQQAQDQGSVYYTLTYSPTNTNFDGAMRHIKVQLDKQGYELSYRKTYFADATNPAVGAGPGGTPPVGAPDPLTPSMRHGAPISSELFFLSTVLPAGGVTEATAQELAQLSQFAAAPKKKLALADKGTVKVQHFEIAYSILGRMLEMPPINNGKFGLNLEFAAAAFDDDGLLLNGLSVQVKQPLSAADHDKIKTNGYRTKLSVALPLDARWMRIAVRDATSGHTGSIEIPLPSLTPPKP